MHIQARKYTNIRYFLSFSLSPSHHIHFIAISFPLNERNRMQSIYVYRENHSIPKCRSCVLCASVLLLYGVCCTNKQRNSCIVVDSITLGVGVDKINTVDMLVIWFCIGAENIVAASRIPVYKLLNY